MIEHELIALLASVAIVCSVFMTATLFVLTSKRKSITTLLDCYISSSLISLHSQKQEPHMHKIILAFIESIVIYLP